MSFEIKLAGHSSAPHNTAVQALADEFLERVQEELEGVTVTLTGYSSDTTGSITLTGTNGPPKMAAGEEPPGPGPDQNT